MPESEQKNDGSRLLLFRRGDPECAILGNCYEGLRFNQIQLFFLPHTAQQDDPERDDCEALFNVSGSGAALIAHGFASADWWRSLPPCGMRYNCRTENFGRAWYVARTRSGYRLQGARYIDAMSKLASALLPATYRMRPNPRSPARAHLSNRVHVSNIAGGGDPMGTRGEGHADDPPASAPPADSE